jgi:hypothetical protein
MQDTMSCSSEEKHILFDYATDLLAADCRQKVEEHLAHCAGCREELAAVRQLAADLSKLEAATRHDLSADSAAEVLDEAALLLRPRHREPRQNIQELRRRARSKARWGLVQRMLMPLAAAAAVIVGLHLYDALLGSKPPAPPSAVEQLAAQADAVDTVAGILELEPAARAALDETMLAPSPGLGRVGNLQLVHYITTRAKEPGQIEDVRFLLRLLRDDEQKHPALALRSGFWDALASLETRAEAAEPPAVFAGERVRNLMQQGKYDEVYRLLAADRSLETRPLAAYAAIRAGHTAEARAMLDAAVQVGRGNPELVELLRAEAAIDDLRWYLATNHYAAAAENDNRLWFQAGYLWRYELHNDVKAGEYFARTADERVAAHVARRFKTDVDLARQAAPLYRQDFESYAANTVPAFWKVDQTRPGETLIVQVDGSNVLKQDDLGRFGNKLTFGYPGWNNYTFACDFKVLHSGSSAQFDLVVYELGLTHYALRFEGNTAHLVERLFAKGESQELEPAQSRVTLPASVLAGDWWQASIRVQNLNDRQTEVTARIWPRGHQEQVQTSTWTESAAAGSQPLRRGHISFHLGDAEVAIDNILVTANDSAP